jgi:hypothetical protein
MKIKLLLLFVFFAKYINGQIVTPSNFISKNLNVMNQSQIDSLNAFDGVTVINSSSGCLNYFVNGSWFELCGKCIPELSLPKIDSIFQLKNELFIFFTANTTNELSIGLSNHIFVRQDSSPVKLKIPVNTDNMKIFISVKGVCGKRDSLLSVNVKPFVVSKLESFEFGAQKILTRKIGNTRWLCEDYINPSIKPPLKNNATLTNPYINEKICPNDWALPTKDDWDNVLSIYTKFEEIFDKPTDENRSLGLVKKGVYSVLEKKIYGETAAYYWTNDNKDGNQGLVSITNEGMIFVFESAKKALMQVRCVKYD